MSRSRARGSLGTTHPAILAGLVVLLLAGCVTAPKVAENPPPAPREFRGVWVATVANIDWPSQPGLPAAQQRAEAVAILDRARALNLNAVILQVRPAADALYASALEPWSEYLGGQQGRDPGYDPLKFWIEEAHRRGLALHAWFNPYRARHHEAKSDFAPTHIAKTNPAAVKPYGELWWMDPGDAFASRRTLDVIADVVRRYDVDGVHIDDYFYPYPIPRPEPVERARPGQPKDGKEMLDFPDEPSWQLYRSGGGKLERADWRRDNVDRLVEKIYRTVHAIKPQVLFGVSPFGLGRPDRRPPGIEGFSQYDKIYADVERWLERGWLDYLAPQLYWPPGQKAQAFDVLLDYWARQNLAHRHLWPGLFTSAINDTPKGWRAEDILQEVGLVRARPAAGGLIQFSMVALMQDRKGVATKLLAGPYAEPALLPATPWLKAAPPTAPKLRRNGERVEIEPGSGDGAANFAIWRRHGVRWDFALQPASTRTIAAAVADAVVVSAVDRLGNESESVALTPGRRK
ncbi:MAG: family 10 glycosylhydrolase [Opitutae bacterium]|nr:family 10 glycosylhydrolase [Opitutae bacterium]